jgi:hypothetical protein
MQVERKCSEKDAHYAFVRADCAPIKCGRRRGLFNLITFSGRHKSNRAGGRIAFVVMAPWLCTCIADCSAHKLKLCIRLTLSELYMACCIALDPALISLTGKIHQINKSKSSLTINSTSRIISSGGGVWRNPKVDNCSAKGIIAAAYLCPKNKLFN